MENNDYIEVLAILPYIELSKQVEKEAEAYPHPVEVRRSFSAAISGGSVYRSSVFLLKMFFMP